MDLEREFSLVSQKVLDNAVKSIRLDQSVVIPMRIVMSVELFDEIVNTAEDTMYHPGYVLTKYIKQCILTPIEPMIVDEYNEEDNVLYYLEKEE